MPHFITLDFLVGKLWCKYLGNKILKNGTINIKAVKLVILLLNYGMSKRYFSFNRINIKFPHILRWQQNTSNSLLFLKYLVKILGWHPIHFFLSKTLIYPIHLDCDWLYIYIYIFEKWFLLFKFKESLKYMS